MIPQSRPLESTCGSWHMLPPLTKRCNKKLPEAGSPSCHVLLEGRRKFVKQTRWSCWLRCPALGVASELSLPTRVVCRTHAMSTTCLQVPRWQTGPGPQVRAGGGISMRSERLTAEPRTQDLEHAREDFCQHPG